MEIRKNANLVSHIFPLEGALFGVLFSLLYRKLRRISYKAKKRYAWIALRRKGICRFATRRRRRILRSRILFLNFGQKLFQNRLDDRTDLIALAVCEEVLLEFVTADGLFQEVLIDVLQDGNHVNMGYFLNGV